MIVANHFSYGRRPIKVAVWISSHQESLYAVMVAWSKSRHKTLGVLCQFVFVHHRREIHCQGICQSRVKRGALSCIHPLVLSILPVVVIIIVKQPISHLFPLERAIVSPFLAGESPTEKREPVLREECVCLCMVASFCRRKSDQ